MSSDLESYSGTGLETLIDRNRVECMIESIPETTGNRSVMPKMQKEFYLELMRIRHDDVLSHVANSHEVPNMYFFEFIQRGVRCIAVWT